MAHLPAHCEPPWQVAEREIRRHHEHQVLQQLSHVGEVPVELEVGVGVLLRELRDLFRGLSCVPPQRHRGAILVRHPIVRIEDRDLVSEFLEFQLANYLRRHQARDVGGGRDLVTGPDFLRHGGAPDSSLALEHEYVGSGPREIGGAGESVVAAPYDDHVMCCHAYPCRGFPTAPARSRRARAAEGSSRTAPATRGRRSRSGGSAGS